jgi:hypothetical protein
MTVIGQLLALAASPDDKIPTVVHSVAGCLKSIAGLEAL